MQQLMSNLDVAGTVLRVQSQRVANPNPLFFKLLDTFSIRAPPGEISPQESQRVLAIQEQVNAYLQCLQMSAFSRFEKMRNIGENGVMMDPVAYRPSQVPKMRNMGEPGVPGGTPSSGTSLLPRSSLTRGKSVNAQSSMSSSMLPRTLSIPTSGSNIPMMSSGPPTTMMSSAPPIALSLSAPPTSSRTLSRSSSSALTNMPSSNLAQRTYSGLKRGNF